MALRSLLKKCRSFPTVPSHLFTQRFHLSSNTSSNAFHVELVDPDTWQMSSCLSHSWQSSKPYHPLIKLIVNDEADRSHTPSEEGDLDSLDSMRIRGDLFYKLEKGSKEFEEWNLDFHRRNHKKGKEVEKKKIEQIEKEEIIPRVRIKGREYSLVTNSEPKKKRSPTFNQVTGPYHEPFSLDIFVSRSSISAAVVHRASSKVVAVAHSISKDIKCDLTSTKNIAACALIGRVLASRALADDIHDVVYTPRKGDKIEGKLKIVLESIMENGINVKVKIKKKQFQKRLRVL